MNTRQPPNSSQRFLEIGQRPTLLFVSGAFERYVNGDQARPVKPAIDLYEIEKRAPHGNRSGNKHDREHHLRRDQRFTNETCAPRIAGAAGSERMGATGVQRGSTPKSNPLRTDAAIAKHSTRPSQME